ncbi:MAG: DJ-1/PfpI family protein [Clostridia bacterium]|nr:DJ-1/PfpI family protein [Clostridia bacterium]
MVYMFLAEGFEETEAIGCLDVLRRAKIKVKTVGISAKCVTGSHHVMIIADILKDEIKLDEFDGIILPGGMPGTSYLENDRDVINMIKYCVANKKMIASICAAPMISGKMGLLKGKNAVCYPGFEEFLYEANIVDAPVVTDGNFITAKGAGAAMLFGAEIVEYFKPGKGKEILEQMQHAAI